jgi:hypothetical protein
MSLQQGLLAALLIDVARFEEACGRDGAMIEHAGGVEADVTLGKTLLAHCLECRVWVANFWSPIHPANPIPTQRSRNPGQISSKNVQLPDWGSRSSVSKIWIGLSSALVLNLLIAWSLVADD